MAENLFADIPQHLPEELFQQLASGSRFSLKRIVSKGQSTDWYDQDQQEWVVMLKGAATLEFEDRIKTLQPGDYVLIPAHQKHRVSWTDPNQETVWLAIYYER